jgi:hypothetical protein
MKFALRLRIVQLWKLDVSKNKKVSGGAQVSVFSTLPNGIAIDMQNAFDNWAAFFTVAALR